MDLGPPPAFTQDGPPRPAVEIGGEWRVRLEHQDAPDYGVTESARGRVLQRLTLHADVEWTPGLRTFFELTDTRVFDDAPVNSAEASGVDLQSAFVEARLGGTLSVTAGRQPVVFNTAQRFVSLREGPGVRRAFDGIRAVWSAPGWRVDTLVSRPVRNAPDDFDDSANGAVTFGALYLSRTTASTGLEAYLFDYRNTSARFAAVSGREHRRMIGARLTGAVGGSDYDLEAAYQVGDLGSRSVRAWAVAAVVGHTWGAAGTPRLGLEIDLGSGDSDPADARLETFNPLFPNGGVFDQFSLTSWANSCVVRAGLSAKPRADLRIGASVAGRFKLEQKDGVYLNPATPIPGTADVADRWLGLAARADLEWTIREDLVLTGQALWSEAEGALAAAGAQDGVHGFLALRLRF